MPGIPSCALKILRTPPVIVIHGIHFLTTDCELCTSNMYTYSRNPGWYVGTPSLSANSWIVWVKCPYICSSQIMPLKNLYPTLLIYWKRFWNNNTTITSIFIVCHGDCMWYFWLDLIPKSKWVDDLKYSMKHVVCKIRLIPIPLGLIAEVIIEIAIEIEMIVP